MNASFPLAFVGGGNMASAIIGGLLRRGAQAAHITVVEPVAEQAQRLAQAFGVKTLAEPGDALAAAKLVIWAVKPQTFAQAAAASKPFLDANALHLSVAAGIRTDAIAAWLGSERVVRAMPNTPALIGQGISGLYARASEDAPLALNADDLAVVESVMDTTGQWLWVREEKQLDAVTALSGSGPAYVFYFLESLVAAGLELDLDADTAKQLALKTFAGSTALAQGSSEGLATLRERVTSKGGTTFAALEVMRDKQVDAHIVAAVHAAAQRAKELGDELGA
jgi:pyrroline-5-carboxylate reductase